MKTTTKKETIKVFKVVIDQDDCEPNEKDFETDEEYQEAYDKWEDLFPHQIRIYLVGANDEEEAMLFVKKEIEPVEISDVWFGYPYEVIGDKIPRDYDIQIMEDLKVKKKGILE